ncbi:MAG: hypothetical protein KME29_22700 [Calothrix sp. FI2-JRJ7]|jgi:hypothetical protein|nr:hypothetical protein [Calothrix sp. FI2-JRJ7]
MPALTESGRVELLQHLYCTLVLQTSCHPHSSTFHVNLKSLTPLGRVELPIQLSESRRQIPW